MSCTVPPGSLGSRTAFSSTDRFFWIMLQHSLRLQFLYMNVGASRRAPRWTLSPRARSPRTQCPGSAGVFPLWVENCVYTTVGLRVLKTQPRQFSWSLTTPPFLPSYHSLLDDIFFGAKTATQCWLMIHVRGGLCVSTLRFIFSDSLRLILVF